MYSFVQPKGKDAKDAEVVVSTRQCVFSLSSRILLPCRTDEEGP